MSVSWSKLITSSSLFRWIFNECRKSFYRAFNLTFACNGRKASDDVIVQLVTKECLPVLLYTSEVLRFNSGDYRSLSYVIDCTHLERFSYLILMMRFSTAEMELRR